MAAGNYFLAFAQALQHLQLITQVLAQFDFPRLEVARLLADDDQCTGAGTDDGFGRQDQARGWSVADLQAQQQSGDQFAAAVIDLESRLQGARAGVDLWQDFLQLAFEGLGCIGLQNGLDLLATRQTYGLCFRHFSHGPDLL